MPLAPASVVAAEPWSPLTAARPEPGETHSTFPPSAATCAAKSAGTEPLKDTMWRTFAEEAPRATVANWGARAAAAGSAGPDGRRASYTHAAVATTPTVANRGTNLTSDTGRLAATGDREHGADSEGQQAGLRARGRCKCQDCVKSWAASLPHAKTRKHTIEHVVGRHHADQVIERPHRGAQVGRGRGCVHAVIPRHLERVHLGEGALQRPPVAGPRHHRLHVAQRQQAAVRLLRELATQVREALTGHHRDGDGRPAGRTGGPGLHVDLCAHEHNRGGDLGQELVALPMVPLPAPRSPLLAVEHQ